MKRFFVLAGMLILAGGVFAGPDSARPVGLVHTRVIRDFVLRFDEVSYAQWTPDGKGSTMYFIRDGFHNRAVYDAYGRWKYSLIFYDEARMPRDVRTVVKREYFDFGITVVEEVQTVAGRAWLVHLEDKSTIKIVRVNTEGEMETMEEFYRL